MLVVVVLPCAPATAIVALQRAQLAQQLGARHDGRPRSRAATRSGLSAAIAVERTTTSSPRGQVGGVMAGAGVDPGRAQPLERRRVGAVGAADRRAELRARRARSRSCRRRRCRRGAASRPGPGRALTAPPRSRRPRRPRGDRARRVRPRQRRARRGPSPPAARGRRAARRPRAAARAGVSSRVGDDDRGAGVAPSSARCPPGGRPRRAGRERGSRAGPWRRSRTPSRRRARRRGPRRRAPARSRST